MAEKKHVEIYKKYRPAVFSELVGQTKTASSLKAAVAKSKIPTAYGFFGERGCGKTSAAWIIAKAINCENPQDGDPCNSCDTCYNIDRNAQPGVNYISMANKGAVEDVRELVQTARLSTPLNRQVFILDEVHNLSKQGYDALLIPLEDPSMPALFILCSTEVNKIPQTILSRIQSRRFSLVSAEKMTAYVKIVAEKEGLQLTDDELASVVRSGRGSVRDTLSALEGVSDLGADEYTFSGRLFEALVAQDQGQLFAVIAEATAENIKGRELAEQLFHDLRDLYIVASGGSLELAPNLPVADVKDAAKKLLGARGVSVALSEVGDGLTRMSMGADSRIHLEIALVKTLQRLKAAKAKTASA